MILEIDVSGSDILNKDYTICVANANGIIKGFKLDERLIQKLKSKRGKGIYRYPNSKRGKAFFRIRLYCIIIYYIIKNIKISDDKINLNICRDFKGHEKDITSNLKFFLEDKLGFKVEFNYLKLSKDSNADKYASLMRRDVRNKIDGYVKISLEDLEKYLKR